MSVFGAASPTANPVDYEIVSPPSDGVSSMSFSPKGNFLCATSWDNQVRVWEVMYNQNMKNSAPKAQTTHEAPVLQATWHSDGSKIFAGGCDNKAKCWDLNTNQSVQVAAHNAPVKSCIWIDQMQCLVTGSWDKTLKYWDLRNQNPVASVNLPERCYHMDVVHPLAVVATADKQLIVYNLANPNTEYKKIPTPLKYQTRVVTCFPSRTGFAVGSIEGRVGIQYVEEKDTTDNFAFKCHRENNTDLYAVNSIVFHPVFGTFATAGADGSYNFWDKDSKQRLKQFPKGPQPIPCAAFNSDGTIYAYASSYDWSKGADNYNPAQSKNSILLHSVVESEVKPRPAPKKR